MQQIQALTKRALLTPYGAFREQSTAEFFGDIRSADYAHYILGKYQGEACYFDKLDTDDIEGQLADVSERADTIYFSPTGGFGTAAADITFFSGIWLEFDANNKQILTTQEQLTAIDQILYELRQSALFGGNIRKHRDKLNYTTYRLKPFLPSHIIATSSGSFQLHFQAPTTFKTVEEREERFVQYKAIVDRIIKGIERNKRYKERSGDVIDFSIRWKWHLDKGASSNPIQPMRMPGSLHSRTGKVARVYTRRDIHTREDAAAYDWEILARWAGCPTTVQAKSNVTSITKARKKARRTFEPKQFDLAASAAAPKSGRHTIGQWFGRQLWHCLNLINSGNVATGQRNMVAWLAYNALLQLRAGSPTAKEQALKDLQPIFCESFTRSMFESYISTTERIGGYKMSLSKFNEKMQAVGLPTLISHARPKLSPDEIKARQSDAGHATNHKRRSSTLAAIADSMIKRVGSTQAEIAEHAERGLRTVKRYYHEAKQLNREQLAALQTRVLAEENEGANRYASIYPYAVGMPSGGVDGLVIHRIVRVREPDKSPKDRSGSNEVGQMVLFA